MTYFRKHSYDDGVTLSVTPDVPRKREVIVNKGEIKLFLNWYRVDEGAENYDMRSKAVAGLIKAGYRYGPKEQVLTRYLTKIPSLYKPGSHLMSAYLPCPDGKHLSEAEKAMVVLWEVNG